MKEESSKKMNRQTKSSYVTVPNEDLEEQVKISTDDHDSSKVRKMPWLPVLFLLGMSLLFLHKVMFYHHVASVFHFAKHGPPCHHHVQFDHIPNEEHHHAMNSNSMRQPPEMRSPPHGQNEHGHHMKPQNMVPPGIHHWNDNLDSSVDSEDESSDLDIWERTANFWTGSEDHSTDSSDSSDDSEDDSSDLDIWERIADFWTGSKDSSDSSDDSEDEDVWERIADTWLNIMGKSTLDKN